ncbi:MAG: hypothetical protein HN475_04680 [Piscirickettsiaceae bacterium]|nr:hypothetical protein [Piscirickettsiaceae bacterium]
MTAELMGQEVSISAASDAMSLLLVQETAVDTFTVNVVPRGTLSVMLPLVSNGTNQTNAEQTLTTMVLVLGIMSEQKAMIGASINRLKTTINNLTASSINSEMALGRIVDTDFALESQKLAKQQVLNQSSNAMLVQTNNSKSALL